MKKSLKILNLIDIPWYSGLMEYALLQSKALKENGHHVFFALPKENKVFDKINKEFETISISDRKKIIMINDILRVYRFVKQKGIDIINAHTGRMQTLAYLISKIKPQIKIIRTKADAKNIKKSFTYSKVLKVICGSKYIENMYKNLSIKVKTQTIYLSYPPLEFHEVKKEKPFKITIVGRLDPIKGHENFIKAGILILKQRDDVVFYIAGKEENIKWYDLEKKIPKEYRKYFIYLGYVDDVYELMKNSHIGVISSIGSEAVSRVAIEWMNVGRLIISSNAGCLNEIIDEGYIYPLSEYQTLAKKIIENLDFEKIDKTGRENRERFLSLFSYGRFKYETLKVFENI